MPKKHKTVRRRAMGEEAMKKPKVYIEYRRLPNKDLEYRVIGDSDLLDWGHGGINDVYSLLEATGQLGNGWDAIEPEVVGALTSAPIFGDGVTVEDDGTKKSYGDVWWFPNYAVEDPIETLREKGRVVFDYAPPSKKRSSPDRVRRRG